MLPYSIDTRLGHVICLSQWEADGNDCASCSLGLKRSLMFSLVPFGISTSAIRVALSLLHYVFYNRVLIKVSVENLGLRIVLYL